MGFTDLLADLYSSFTFTEVQAEAQAHKAADVDHVVQGKPDHPDYQADGSKERNEDGKEAEGDNDEGSKGEEAGEDDAGSDDSGDTSDSGDGQDEAEAEPEQEEAAEEEQEEPEDPKPKLEEGTSTIVSWSQPSLPSVLFPRGRSRKQKAQG